MRLYIDSSAALKRSVHEAESAALGDYLDGHSSEGAVLVASDLTRIEVCRALMRVPGLTAAQLSRALDDASGDVAHHPLSADVVALAMRTKPAVLRSLDAIHLATAVLLEVDILVTYDQRLADACSMSGVEVAAPM